MVFSCFLFYLKGVMFRTCGGLRGSALSLVFERWEPVFRGERRKVILDRAKLSTSYN